MKNKYSELKDKIIDYLEVDLGLDDADDIADDIILIFRESIEVI
jgi:hypothetical protein